MFGCPARKHAKEPVRDGISPIPHLIGESSFLLSCFFGHSLLLSDNCSKKRAVHGILPAFRARRTRKGYLCGFGNMNTSATSQKLKKSPTKSRRRLPRRR